MSERLRKVVEKLDVRPDDRILEIEKLKERHGWEHIPWYTITDEWDKDFGVDEWHGHNAFIREGERIYRTYFIDSRGDEAMGTTWSYLDMAPLGRQEDWEDSPEDYPQLFELTKA